MKSTAQWMREGERIAKITLSIQASEYHYSHPRVTGLPIDQYSAVEVGFLAPSLCYPSDAGIEGFDHFFDGGCLASEERSTAPVAAYMPVEAVNRLREACRALERKP